MIDWVLIVFVYAGMLSKGDSVALTVVDGFSTQEQCVAAGKRAGSLVGGTIKDAKFVCVQRGGLPR